MNYDHRVADDSMCLYGPHVPITLLQPYHGCDIERCRTRRLIYCFLTFKTPKRHQRVQGFH